MERCLLGDVEIDVVEEEQLALENEVTEKAVERGADIADHVRQEPITLRLTVILAGDDWTQRYAQLRQMRDSGDIVDYAGALEIVSDVVIESLTPLKSAKVGNGVMIDIALKQVTLATPEVVTFGPDPVTQAEPPDEEEDAGEQQLQEEETDEESQSLLVSVVQAGGRAIGAVKNWLFGR